MTIISHQHMLSKCIERYDLSFLLMCHFRSNIFTQNIHKRKIDVLIKLLLTNKKTKLEFFEGKISNLKYSSNFNSNNMLILQTKKM